MAGRKAFLLRIDPGLWNALERWAADELRSVNGQMEYLLARAVREAKRGPKTSRERMEREEGPERGGEPAP